MSQTPLEMAKELTQTLIEQGQLPSEDMQETLQTTYAILAALKTQEDTGSSHAQNGTPLHPVDWRKSITRHAVTCLECGQTLKQLSQRHLQLHGLDGNSYRQKYGIPRAQPLAARATTARRREVVQETRPWEKAPRYGQAKKQAAEKATSSARTAAKAPAQPTQQRKASSKKKAAKKSG